MQKKPLAIFGDGIAGLSAAQMLARLGHSVEIFATDPPSSRRVALNEASLFLIERIWGRQLMEAAAAKTLDRRIVFWEGGEPAVLIDHALVVDVADLSARMKAMLEKNCLVTWSDASARDEPDLVAAPFGGRTRYLSGGGRRAVQAQVLLSAEADARALYVEAVKNGWLVLLPTGGDRASLMGVALGSNVELEALLDETRHTRRAVVALHASSSSSSAAPRLYVPSNSAHSAMRIGSTAMRFDPISGDGVAGALRGAHLAALLLDRRAQDGDDFDTRAIYEQRLARAMRAHLGGLARLYSASPMAKSWRRELQAMQAMSRCIDKLWSADNSKVAIMENALAAL